MYVCLFALRAENRILIRGLKCERSSVATSLHTHTQTETTETIAYQKHNAAKLYTPSAWCMLISTFHVAHCGRICTIYYMYVLCLCAAPQIDDNTSRTLG